MARKNFNFDITLSLEVDDVDDRSEDPKRDDFEGLIYGILEAAFDRDLRSRHRYLSSLKTERVHLRGPRPKPLTAAEQRQLDYRIKEKYQQHLDAKVAEEEMYLSLLQEMIRQYGEKLEGMDDWRPLKSENEYSDEEIIKTPVFFRILEGTSVVSQGRTIRLPQAAILPLCRDALKQMWESMEQPA